MNRLRVLIVDDEPLAREGLRAQLVRDPDVEIVGECANGRAAVSAIKKLTPDLVLLDVQMPLLDGFGVVDMIGAERMPVVIFVTGYDEYALRAFEAQALDYLLKPVDAGRLHTALRRAKEQLLQRGEHDLGRRLSALLQELKGGQAGGEPPKRPLERVAIKTGERIIFLDVAEIEWIEAQDNYVRLHGGAGTHLLRETMANMVGKLGPAKFLRISRSIIVNAAHVQELRPLFNGEYVIILHGGTQVRSSRRYRKNLEPLLKN